MKETGSSGWLRAFARAQNETLDIDRIALPLAGLPDALVGFRIGVLADLHMYRITSYHARILEALAAEKPDALLLAGDSVDGRTEDVSILSAFFMSLGRMAPCAAVLGNNDANPARTQDLRDVYARAGIILLENETRQMRAYGYPLRITGLTDPEAIRCGVHPTRDSEQVEHVPLSGTLSPQQVEPDDRASTTPETGERSLYRMPSILLMHQPQLAVEYAHMEPSLIVAGHAHGGQFRIPPFGGLYAPGQGLLPKYTSGLYTVGNSRMLVSRGLGNHSFPLRLNNKPHLPIVVFEKQG